MTVGVGVATRKTAIVAGTETAVLMVESEAEELSEEQMLGAVMFGLYGVFVLQDLLFQFCFVSLPAAMKPCKTC